VLVNAAGAWAGRIAAALGEPVPVETVAPMLMITSRVPHFIDPVVILRGRKLSFKQFANGTVLIGGGHLATPHQDSNETVLDWRSLAVSARTVFELFPVMRDATIVRAWAGIEARTRDDRPCRRAPHRLFTSSAFRCMAQLGLGAGAVMASDHQWRHPARIGDLGIDRFSFVHTQNQDEDIMNIIRNIRTPTMHRAVEANGLVFVGGTIADDTSASMGEQTRNIRQDCGI
jgi:sarcosine oxidase subunit beta